MTVARLSSRSLPNRGLETTFDSHWTLPRATSSSASLCARAAPPTRARSRGRAPAPCGVAPWRRSPVPRPVCPTRQDQYILVLAPRVSRFLVSILCAPASMWRFLTRRYVSSPMWSRWIRVLEKPPTHARTRSGARERERERSHARASTPVSRPHFVSKFKRDFSTDAGSRYRISASAPVASRKTRSLSKAFAYNAPSSAYERAQNDTRGARLCSP